MESRKRSQLFLSIFGLLWAQYVFAHLVTEPFPSVVFPGFGSVREELNRPAERTVLRAEVQLLDATGRSAVATDEFFAGPHISTRGFLLDRSCPRALADDREMPPAGSALRRWVDRLRGGRFRHTSPRLATWMVRRAEELRGRSVERVEIVWHRDRIVADTGELLNRKETHRCLYRTGTTPRVEVR